MQMKILDTFLAGFKVAYTGLEIIPYQQVVGWVNPSAVIFGNKTFFDFSGHGLCYANFGIINTNYHISAPSFDISIVDIVSELFNGTTPAFLPTAADLSLAVNGAYALPDPHLSVDLSSAVDPYGNWIGTNLYLWETSLFGTIPLYNEEIVPPANDTTPANNTTLAV